MKNYRELSAQESEELSNISCTKEANDVLSKYGNLQVFKVVYVNEYSGEKYYRFFLAETAKRLSVEIKSHLKNISRVTFQNFSSRY